VLVLLVGVLLLAKWAADNALFPVEARLAVAALIGLALTVVGYRLREARPGFGTTLQGGGIAALYLVVFVALVVAVAAPWVLGKGERVGTTWGAVVLGFAGAALLIGPDLRVGHVYGLWALAGAALSAAAHLAVRSLGRDHSPFTVVVVFQVSCIPLGAGTLLLLEGRLPVLPSAEHWVPLAVVAVAASLGQLLMTQAYRLDRAAPIAAASYTAPLWGVLADLAWFAEFPGWRVWTGGTVVVAAGLWLVLRRDAQSSQVPSTTASS